MDYAEQQSKNGRKGGNTTLKRYGREHFSSIRKKREALRKAGTTEETI